MLDPLKQTAYEALLHETFRLALDGGSTVDMHLRRVERLSAASPKYDSFAVEFRGPHECFLQQQSYSLTHDKMGTFDLFLVAVEEADDGYIYQSVFNVAKAEDGSCV